MNKNLSPAKRALLEKWLQGQSNENSTSIPRRLPGSATPVSFPQRRQLFLELLNPGTAVNNLSVFIELQGKLDVPALEQSANKIVARHDMLRTRFSFDKGLPVPEVLVESRIALPTEDLRQLCAGEQITMARQHAEREVLIPFDLAQAPLIRLRLYVVNEEKYLLLVVAHHTIADGWSLGVFLRELMAFYQEINSGKASLLTELPVQYADFAHWQTGEKLQTVLQASLPYWKKQLDGELPVLELPTDRLRGAKQTFAGGTHRFIIPKATTEALEKLGRESDATLFMVLLTAYYILLHRYSGQDEIIVGSPIANRNHPDLENMIGVFINTLSLRVNFSANPGFREALQQVRGVCLEAYAHQDLPFEKLVEELKPQRDLSRTPVFQAVFNLQSSPLPKLEIPGIETRFLDIDRGVSQFDLTLMVSRLEEQCHATVEYNNDLFEAATVAGLFRSYQLLLEDIIAHPGRPVSRLRLISEEERRHFIDELNRTELAFPRDKCFHQLFEARAEQTPDAVAVICGHDSLTYSGLNRRANILANHLKNLGAGPGTRIGILLERSVEMMEALLGVLKAGATYVPVHTSFPAERVQFMLHDANVKVLLTNTDQDPLSYQNIHVVNLNDTITSPGDGSNPCVGVAPAHLAYIIYTSGSTGTPKGVMVRHSSLVNFLCSMLQRPGIESKDILLSVTSISFDIAALELFLPLITGATVVIAGREMIADPARIGQAIKEHKISVMQATPATWQLLIESGWKGEPGLKALCGGEALTRKLAGQLLSRTGDLWNMYGPTETTIWSSVNRIVAGDDPIAIGLPVGNTQLYILDKELQLVPAGVAGELHIGGEGLAQGYLNHDHLTREKFIPDPFSSLPGARLYKTGDRARYLVNGSIGILGRGDDQVKINGHRIELGEIASILLQHASVQDGIVIARQEDAGEKRLVAYVVPKIDSPVNTAELREFLGKKLPPFMIPAFFVSLDSLPLTPNGKIDRKALPFPGEARWPDGYAGPRNEVEKTLREIWQHVLQLDRVSIHDNFFDLGGASMQSLQVVARANSYGFQLTVENIFEYQTIAGLAAHLEQDLITKDNSSA